MSSFFLNGVFQGYKLFYRETHDSSHTKYSGIVVYGNRTGYLITGLQPLTNYTLRVLAFTLSGDGLLSDSLFTVNTLDGPGRLHVCILRKDLNANTSPDPLILVFSIS